MLQAAPFQNLIPRPYAKDGESLEGKIRRLEAKYAAMSLVNIIKKLGTEKVKRFLLIFIIYIFTFFSKENLLKKLIY